MSTEGPPWGFVTRDEYVETLKSAALVTGKTGIMAYLISVVPFLGLPVMKAITSWFVEKVLWIAITKTELGAYFLFIDLRTSAQGREYFDAAVKHKTALAGGTDEEKKNAEADLINKFRALVKFSN